MDQVVPLSPGAIRLYDSRGRSFLIDAADEKQVRALTWYVKTDGRVKHSERKKDGSKKKLDFFLHRWLLGYGREDPDVDHMNGDPLDCRRANLRPATRSENNQNRRGWGKGTGVKGVYRASKSDNFIVRVRKDGRLLNYGVYPDIETAARIRDAIVKKQHGAFARPAIPPDAERT
jgi:hypothetical protein